MKILSLLIYLFLASSLLEGYSKKIILGTYSKKSNADRELSKLKSKIPEYKKLHQLSKENDFDIYVRPYGKYHIVVVEPIKNKKVLFTSLNIIKKGFKGAFVSDASEIEKKSYTKSSLKRATEIKEKKALLQSKPEVVSVQESRDSLAAADKSKDSIEESIEVKTEAEQNMPALMGGEVKNDKNASTAEQETQPSITPLVPSKVTQSRLDEAEKEPETPSLTEVISRHFHWSYIILIIILGVMAYYLIKFKKIYDQY